MWKITFLTSLSPLAALDITWKKTNILHMFWLLGQLKNTMLTILFSTFLARHR
jgi:hypothetical protein